MIHNQQNLAIQFTDGKRINLKRLKNEIDRKMIKIQILAQKIPLTQIQQSTNGQYHQKSTTNHASIQTDPTHQVSDKENQNSHPPLQEKVANKFRKPSTNKEERPLIRDRKPITIKETDFLICKAEEPLINPEPQQNKIGESCTTMTLSSIPQIELPQLKHKRTETEHGGSVSPIYKQNFKKTERSMMIKSKTSRTIHNQFQVVVISQECLIKMQNFVASLKEKGRKQPSDHTLRTNLLKKVEEKFRPNTKMHY